MRNLMRRPGKCLITLAIVLVWTTLIALAPATASAHTLHQSVAASQHSYQQPISIHTHSPRCSGSVSLSPYYLQVHVKTSFGILATWSCEGNFYVQLDVNWGDGGTSSYTCVANCSSGSQDMHHTYNSQGTFYPDFVMGGNASGAASATVVVTS